MGALVRQPPKPHDEKKTGKPKKNGLSGSLRGSVAALPPSQEALSELPLVPQGPVCPHCKCSDQGQVWSSNGRITLPCRYIAETEYACSSTTSTTRTAGSSGSEEGARINQRSAERWAANKGKSGRRMHIARICNTCDRPYRSISPSRPQRDRRTDPIPVPRPCPATWRNTAALAWWAGDRDARVWPAIRLPADPAKQPAWRRTPAPIR
jgi:hypothetical protein